ncbi:MAG: right-handed parallel beta-helix repeat-containing protein [Arachnia sp.]
MTHRSPQRRRMVLATALTAITLTIPLAVMAPTANAAATTHHVDCASPTNGTGTVAAPLNSVAAANALTLAAGDSLLFKRGTTCRGQLSPQGSGTAAAPALISDYGSSPARAVIDANGAPNAVEIRNMAHTTVENLELTAPGDNKTIRRGLSILGSDGGQLDGVTARNLHIHDVRGYMPATTGGGASSFTGKGPNSSGGIIVETLGSTTPTWFTNLTISGNTITEVDRQGIYFWSNWCRRPDLKRWSDLCNAAYKADENVLVTGNRLTSIGGDGIVITGVTGAVVEHTRLDGFNRRSKSYNAGIWMANSQDVLFQHNEVSGGLGDLDSNAFDIDHASSDITIRNNYSHDNDGGFLLMCPDPVSAGYGGIRDFTVHDNVSIGDADRLLMHGCGGQIFNGRVVNNTFHTPAGTAATTVWADLNGLSPDVLIANNIFSAGTTGNVTFVKPADGLTISNNVYRNVPVPAGATNSVVADPQFTAAGPGALSVQLSAASPARDAGRTWQGAGRDFVGLPYPATGIDAGAFQGAAVGPLVAPVAAGTCQPTLTLPATVDASSGTATVNATLTSDCDSALTGVTVAAVGVAGITATTPSATVAANGTATLPVTITVPSWLSGTNRVGILASTGATGVARATTSVQGPAVPAGIAQNFNDVPVGQAPVGWTTAGTTRPSVAADRGVDATPALVISRTPADAGITSILAPLTGGAKHLRMWVKADQADAPLGIHVLDASGQPILRTSLADVGVYAYTNGSTFVNTTQQYPAGSWLLMDYALLGDGTYAWWVDGTPVATGSVERSTAPATLRLQIPTSALKAGSFVIDGLATDGAASAELPLPEAPATLPDVVSAHVVAVSPRVVEAEGTIAVDVTGADPGTDVTVRLVPTGRGATPTGTNRVNADGTVRVVIASAGASSGSHGVEVDVTSGGVMTTIKPASITIVGTTVAPSPQPTVTVTSSATATQTASTTATATATTTATATSSATVTNTVTATATTTTTQTATATATATEMETATTTATATATETVTATATATSTRTATVTPSPTATPSSKPSATGTPTTGDLYSTPGFHDVNGRKWYTACEAYSQTTRCRTDIWSTQVEFVGGTFVSRTGWHFNNLTYLPYMTRQQWGSNPLANAGEWTSAGRLWRTECDTAQTGRNGCRSSIFVRGVVESRSGKDGHTTYVRVDKWVFNNIVRFS